ncbi:MAG TPA: TonB-dependent receptor, partial [Prolixibacteraceae bacterium]|nr:TonB-dependent receptor [Prolixibacteraceae bacterium]
NAGETGHAGIEWLHQMRLFSVKSWPGTARLFASFFWNHNRFINFVDAGRDYSGNLLPGIPACTYHARIIWEPLPQAVLVLEGQGTGSQFMNDANDKRYPGHTLVHARCSVELIRKGRLQIRFEGGIENLFDTPYASMILVNAPSFGGNAPRYYYPGSPRNMYLGIHIEIE